jgi:hypothetical protein
MAAASLETGTLGPPISHHRPAGLPERRRGRVVRGRSAQLQPLVVPQFTHLWQEPLGIMIDPHSGQVGASVRAMKL